MPVISFASGKGGSGKTTAALTLASEIHRRGKTVHLVDADRQLSLFNWFSDWSGNAGISAEDASKVPDDAIDEITRPAALKNDFVIVDLEGTANEKIFWTATISDLVIIPSRASALDLERTIQMKRVVEKAEKARGGDTLPYGVLMTQRTPPIFSRPERNVIDQIKAYMPVLTTELDQLEAFRAMFLYRMTLEEIGQNGIANVARAQPIASNLYDEVISMLTRSAS